MSIVKQLIAIFLIGTTGIAFSDGYNSNTNTNVTHNYPSHVKVDNSGTVVHRHRLATRSEKALAEAQAARQLADVDKPFVQLFCEPIYANMSYCLNATPFGVSNSSILAVIGAAFAAQYLYLRYINSAENS